MPKIKITQKLAETIKNERENRNISARKLSELLGKSISYISSIETDKIKSIDPLAFDDIFRAILDDLDEKAYQNYMNNLTADVEFELTKEEKEKETWLIEYDLILRKIPIHNSIIDYINSELTNLNKTIDDLLIQLNKNETIKEDIQSNKLKVFFNDEKGSIGWSYKFEVDKETIEKILNKEKHTCNYITMLGIIYSLNVIKGINFSDSLTLAENFLSEHKFYKVKELRKAKSQNKISKTNKDTSEFYSYLPDEDFDLENQKKILDEHFSVFGELDVLYSLKTIKSLNNNLKVDLPFMFALFQMPFHKLKNTPKEKKQELIKTIRKLIDEATVENTYDEVSD